MHYSKLIGIGACCAMAAPMWAEIKPAPLFSDGMVLQRDMPVPVWGTAGKGEKVTVSFCGQTVSTVADDQGKWTLKLAKLKAGGPFQMTLAGGNTIDYKQVFVGDVWLCGGQSNMDMVVGACDRADDANSSTTPNMHLSQGGGWGPAANGNNGGFSATGYWFGRCLAEEMKDLPIGLIKCAVGGSTAESWSPGGELYKARLEPLMPYALKGVVWYQGEANTDRPYLYSQAMEVLIAAWRKAFDNPALPFVYMQLPRIGGDPGPDAKLNPNDGWALTREAQQINLAIPNTAMAIYSDCTDGDLHPKNKPAGGKRLAQAALAKVYGRKPAEDYLSPVLKNAVLQDGTLTLSFDNAAQGLKVKDPAADGSIKQFIVVSEDGTQKPAKARLDGGKILVDLRGEKGLPEVYYGFSNYPLGNLYNTAGLPVSPFRLARPKVVVDDSIGNTITLSQDVPFGANALKPESYRVAGYAIRKVEYVGGSSRVRLTGDKPWKIGDTITLEMPGFKQWDGKTGFKTLSFIATPGHVAAGGYFQEMLVGEIHTDVKPETVFKENLVDGSKLDYPNSKTWRLVKSEAIINLSEVPNPPLNALACAHVYVYSNEAQTVNLWYGSDDGARVYVNREPLSTTEGVRPCIPDMVKVKDVKLRKGWNAILFVVSQFAGNWAVMARIVDDNGSPIQGIGYQAEKPADFQ